MFFAHSKNRINSNTIRTLSQGILSPYVILKIFTIFNCLFLIKRDKYLGSSKAFTDSPIYGSKIHKSIIFLSILQPIKYLKPLFLLQENLLDKNITSISTLSMMVRILEELNFCCFDFLTTEVQNFFVYYLLIIILKKTYFVTNYNYIGKKVFY